MFKTKKSTKSALLMSALSLLLCVSMLVGSTFAWFTDEVSSMNNVIKSGNLDVVMEYTTDGENWAEVADDTSIFSEDALWEPGHTEMVALRIKNAGTLALKYALSTSIYLEKEGINVYDQEFKLSDYLNVYASDVMNAYDVAAFEERANATGDGSLVMHQSSFNSDLAGQDELLPGEERVVFVAITMPSSVGNEANYKTGTPAPYIRFGINLYATQTPHEEDSFGDDYDADATIEEVKFPLAIVYDNGPVEDLYVESLFGGGLFDENNNEHLRDMDATYTFVSGSGMTSYEEWIGDYEVSVVTPDGSNLPEGAVVMAGQYNFIDENWQAFYTPEVASGETYRLLSTFGLHLTFDQIKNYVGEFQCGVENINAPAGTVMTVALKLYKQDANNNVLDEHTVGLFTYTFGYANKVNTAEGLAGAMAAGGEVTLVGDVELSDTSITIPTGVETVLDLNGHTITGISTSSTTSYMVKVAAGAELTISNGKLSFEAANPDVDWNPEGFPAYANNTISCSGKLVIDGAIIENTTNPGGASYAIDCYPGSDLVINSGVVDGCGKVAIRMFCNSNTLSTNVTINGGTVTGRRAIWVQLPSSNIENVRLAELTITGGELISTDAAGDNLCIYSYSYGDSFAGTSVTISGGEFTGDIAFGGGKAKSTQENVTITGGIFHGEVGRYVEDDGTNGGWVAIPTP